MKVRINKYIADQGISSRRKADELVMTGQIKVNGVLATVGQVIDSEADVVEIFGRPLIKKREMKVYLLNKPEGVLSSASDDRGRQTVIDLIPSAERLYPVGRLDLNSCGAILVTNDGELAYKMTHPRFHITKEYLVDVDKPITDSHIKQLSATFIVEGKKTIPARIEKITDTQMKIFLYQGLKRQIREMCAQVGLKVLRLERRKIGKLSLGELKPGQYKELSNNLIKEMLS